MSALGRIISPILLKCRELSRSQATPRLEIFPSQEVLVKPINQIVLITCHAVVEKQDLVELQWHDPTGRIISNDGASRTRMHVEMMQGNQLALIIPSLMESEAGNYTCTANYANTQLSKSVQIETIVAVTWVDAPEDQYPIIGTNAKIRCKVEAKPAPNVDWQKNKEPIQTSNHYVIEPDGLLINNVTESDDAVYTCRAIVIDTGELAERKIRVEVHTPPVIEDMVKNVKVVEGEQASVTCKSRGKPQPTFKWIKVSNQKDLSSADRFSVNELTGVLTITKVAQEDNGEIKCVASNAAGTVEKTINLDVVLKPKIVTFANVSMPINKDVNMNCSASGWPRPSVIFRKLTSQSRYGLGVQPGEDRIIVTNQNDDTRNEVVGTLSISQILRTDDGLYECIATNEGGQATKIGHFTVQFPPSFASSPPRDVWSWDRNPVNITCLAEAIPNATIVWKFDNRELELIRDKNIVQFGNQSLSYLTVTPVSENYYGSYSCVARNFLGRVETSFQLRQARPPSDILQSKLDVVTATTITFSFIGPAETGGLDIRAYAVQYKEERQDWNSALNKTWAFESPYILEGLRPKTTYNFRFAARNDAGFGPWSAPQHLTMPERSTPEEPKFFHLLLDGIVHSAYFDQFELHWRIPPDNGEPIDVYDIKYCPARRVNDIWTETGDCRSVERKFEDSTSFLLTGLQSDTYYKVELRAHNNIGFSKPGQVIVKTAMGTDSLVSTSSGGLGSGVIIAIIVASLLLIFIIIDLSCYCVNKSGVMMLICEKTCHTKQEDDDAKLGREEKEPLKDGTKLPVIDPVVKRDTTVEYDVKRSISRTSFVGKDSAV